MFWMFTLGYNHSSGMEMSNIYSLLNARAERQQVLQNQGSILIYGF